MRFLNSRGAVRRNIDGEIDYFSDISSIFAGKSHRDKTQFFGHFQTLQNIGRIAAGADAPRNITGLADRSHLLAEYFGEIIIISDTRNHRCVRGQSDCRKRRSFDNKAVDEFGRKMLGICR